MRFSTHGEEPQSSESSGGFRGEVAEEEETTDDAMVNPAVTAMLESLTDVTPDAEATSSKRRRIIRHEGEHGAAEGGGADLPGGDHPGEDGEPW